MTKEQEIISRLLRRLIAKDQMLSAYRLDRMMPERVFEELEATKGVEEEAKCLVGKK